jgi:pyridoxamine 5'-phosphate oxidase
LAIKLPTALDISTTEADPIRQFQKWYRAAERAGVAEPEAMSVATATPGGKPSSRMVLLRGSSDRGFVFFTNYSSRKGRELATNAHAALLFWWPELRRQVRITGRVKKVSAEESDRYFAQRPKEHRISACASPQSSVVAGRDELEAWAGEIQARYTEKPHPGEGPPRPNYWGGYRVEPLEIEFWQQGANRLHDRIRYRKKKDGTWIRERLAP